HRHPLLALVGAIVALAVPWQSIAESAFVADRFAHKTAPSATIALPLPRADEPIERSYTAFIDANAARADFRTPLEQLLWKLPTWSALIALLFIARTWARRPCIYRI
ncbi:MAG: hypothetical protein GIX03_00935, partial [Candidatus Eremiobacteraeota bacterium]|nr:hypothetical protein [Candidatus Eremiobacteraeota bacterium]